MMTKEGSTKIVNFMTPWGRGSCAEALPYKSYNETAYFLNNHLLYTRQSSDKPSM